MKVLGIYDSIPELRSQEWAVPVSVLWIHKLVTNNTIQKLLQTTVDAVAELACQPRIEWNNGKWKMEGYSPPTLKCQYDSWSCGIFVMMAMSAHQQNIGFDNTGDDMKDLMQTRVLRFHRITIYLTFVFFYEYAHGRYVLNGRVTCSPDSPILYPRFPYHVPPARVLVHFRSCFTCSSTCTVMDC